MNEEFDNELLSAFMDNELSAEEVAAVQEHLEGSEAVRSELDDLKQVSGVLRELPTESAPADLMTSVMAALPKQTPDAEPSTRPRPNRSRWYGLGAMLVGAAALMLMLKVSTGPLSSESAVETANKTDSARDERLATPAAPSARRAMPEPEAAAMSDAGADSDFAAGPPLEAQPAEKRETVQVVRIAGDERKSGDLLTKFLTAQMLDHQRKQRSIEGETVTTFVVSVDVSEVAGMLQKAEAFEDGGLVVRREKPKSVLHQQLMASIELHQQADASSQASKLKAGDEIIASNSVARRNRSLPSPPLPAPAAPSKAMRSAPSAGFGGGGAGFKVAADEKNSGSRKKKSATLVPSAKAEVQIIFVLKPPASDNSSEACTPPAA